MYNDVQTPIFDFQKRKTLCTTGTLYTLRVRVIIALAFYGRAVVELRNLPSLGYLAAPSVDLRAGLDPLRYVQAPSWLSVGGQGEKLALGPPQSHAPVRGETRQGGCFRSC